ncbi:nucleoside monophosphate kinase [Candidatus Saccharibacteria bacterium]|nr:nucleoside monophosphate kinase [Candidatus Saccharibacteria bacterium]
MILLFGSAGSGKSTQGQILAERYDWKWLSTGQMFRESNDPEVMGYVNRGELVPDEITNKVLVAALDANSVCGEKGGVILDGYPRKLEQVKFLLSYSRNRCGNNNINLVVMIDVDKDEVLKRMALRGRDDDTPEEIEKRLGIYHAAIDPILDYLEQENVPVVHIDGVGEIEEIQGRIRAVLVEQGIV